VAREIITAHEIPAPYEVITHPVNGVDCRVLIYSKSLNLQQDGYRMNALGIDPTTGRKVSLAPSTKVELGRPII
jgi:hypothetical protein